MAYVLLLAQAIIEVVFQAYSIVPVPISIATQAGLVQDALPVTGTEDVENGRKIVNSIRSIKSPEGDT